MTTIDVTERQFHATMLSAVNYQTAYCVRGASADQLRKMCHRYGDLVEVVDPFTGPRTEAQERAIVQLMQLSQRDKAMLIPWWPEMPHGLVTRLTILRFR